MAREEQFLFLFRKSTQGSHLHITDLKLLFWCWSSAFFTIDKLEVTRSQDQTLHFQEPSGEIEERTSFPGISGFLTRNQTSDGSD